MMRGSPEAVNGVCGQEEDEISDNFNIKIVPNFFRDSPSTNSVPIHQVGIA
jgi:hypothetical protein